MPISPTPAELAPIRFREGTRLGDYRILREIGAGGMALVWLACHLPLNRLVALKILRPEFSDERNLRRFIREARSAARLDSPAIVRIYEIGTFGGQNWKTAFSSDAESVPTKNTEGIFSSLRKAFFGRGQGSAGTLHYIAEEYVSGINLGLYVRRRGPLSVQQTLEVVRQVAAALLTASDAGLVHRDIKPENILLSDTGSLKVADFGLAFSQEGEVCSDLSLTRAGVTLGTPLYMSPEQAEGGKVDVRSDIYSLGATAFWMLTGRPPFDGGSPMSVLLRHINADPPDPVLYRHEIPRQVADLILRMLEKKKEDRFSSPGVLMEETERLLHETSSGNFSSLSSDSGFTGSDLFAEPSEKLTFTRELNLLETTRLFQNSLTELKFLESGRRTGCRRIRRLIFPAALFFASFFFCGIGVRFLSRSPLEPERLVARRSSVEEQWVLASKLGTSDAWRSVIRFYPREKEWNDRAAQKLACALMEEGRISEAEDLFNEFASGKRMNGSARNFGTAGLAWGFALKGKSDEAAALLARILQEDISCDRQTEVMISTVNRLISKPQE